MYALELRRLAVVIVVAGLAVVRSAQAQTQAIDHPVGTTIQGERVDPAGYGPGEIVTPEMAEQRHLATPLGLLRQKGMRYGEHGKWIVPSQGATRNPKSGSKYVANEWGDLSMGIGFGSVVEVKGAYFKGQGNTGSSARAIRVRGFRDGLEIAATDWFRQLGDEPAWFNMNLQGVDRIVIEADAANGKMAWYAMDDLTFVRPANADGKGSQVVVVDFEDTTYKKKLSGTNYAGLTWEEGTGPTDEPSIAMQAIPAPQAPDGYSLEKPQPVEGVPGGPQERGGGASSPTLIQNFQAATGFDTGSFPPDTCGAIGPTQYGCVVNTVFQVFRRTDLLRVRNQTLSSLQPGTSGDPRILFDQHSQRWFVLSTDFGSNIFISVSLTNSATGSFFSTSFNGLQGADAGGGFIDFPTLGVDQNGIYTGCFITGRGTMTLFAINKAPLVAPSPSLGTVTAFRSLPYEGSLQPAHTYGTPAGEFVLSTRTGTSNQIRVRRVNPPLTAPTLTEVGNITLGTSFSTPPDAPAQGSGTNLDTGDTRLVNCVYRTTEGINGLWASHTTNVGGRAACRWYQFNASTLSVRQLGTIDDPILSYFYPSIVVNNNGSAVVGFSGSSSSQFAACYYVGRAPTDTLGQMSSPALMRAGNAAYQQIDGVGRNRWGDYSLTSLDPATDVEMWTIQEYAHATNTWGTHVGRLSLVVPGDNTPPTPNPMTWQQVPQGITSNAVNMIGSLATDALNNNIEYFFDYLGAGNGNDSGWQTGNNLAARTYTDSPLTENTTYQYCVKARDGAVPPNETTCSTPVTACTLMEAPVNVIGGSPTSNSVPFTVGGSLTNLAVANSGVFVDWSADGFGSTLGNTGWTQTVNGTATGLSPNLLLQIRAKARNQFSIETTPVISGQVCTLALTPAAPILSNPTTDMMDLDIAADGNPAATEYAIQCISTVPFDPVWDAQFVDIGGPPSPFEVWQTDANWAVTTLLGMSPGTTYTFRVKARNQLSLETAYGPQASQSTTPIGGGNGDCDNSGGFSIAGDLPCFVNVLLKINTDPGAITRCDFNADTVVDGRDIPAFVNCVVNGCP